MTDMMRRWVIVCITVALAGCFRAESLHWTWEHPTAGAEQTLRDKVECEQAADQQQANRLWSVGVGDVWLGNIKDRAFQRCMYGRGYSSPDAAVSRAR